MKVRIVVTQERGRYWAEVLGVPGIVSGRTAAEAMRRARKALALYFDAAADALPPTSRAGQAIQYQDVRV
jgi:predicted RNase H-like HicB family nuclease